MQQFIDFIINNWTWLLPVILSVVESIFIIVLKKKPFFNLKDSIQLGVLEMLPIWINEAEEKYPSGINKITYVLQQAVNCYPELFKDSEYLHWLRCSTERVLSTPQKKGGK